MCTLPHWILPKRHQQWVHPVSPGHHHIWTWSNCRQLQVPSEHLPDPQPTNCRIHELHRHQQRCSRNQVLPCMPCKHPVSVGGSPRGCLLQVWSWLLWDLQLHHLPCWDLLSVQQLSVFHVPLCNLVKRWPGVVHRVWHPQSKSRRQRDMDICRPGRRGLHKQLLVELHRWHE